MPRYVILEHDHPHLHWDLMLEWGAALRTWRLERPPTTDQPIAAVALADHRREYLEYEGEVSGGRGRVVRWDAGEYDSLEEHRDWIRLRMTGGRIRGCAYLREDESGAWRFVLTSDTRPGESPLRDPPPGDRPAT
jgi:hypothetical protein